MGKNEMKTAKSKKIILCQFNTGVECDEYLRKPLLCKACGFNPDVDAERKEKLNVRNYPVDVRAILDKTT